MDKRAQKYTSLKGAADEDEESLQHVPTFASRRHLWNSHGTQIAIGVPWILLLVILVLHVGSKPWHHIKQHSAQILYCKCVSALN
jgi:hypothetical protein